MKILAISDIHDDVRAAETLYERVRNRELSAIVCAGDLGKLKNARKIAGVFDKMNIPFLYVLGNWDDFSFDEQLSINSIHLHLRSVEINGWTFVGYSGCSANFYGENSSITSIFEKFKNDSNSTRFHKEAREIRLQELSELFINEGLGNNTVVVSHERIYKIRHKPYLHLFGHIHKFCQTQYKETHFVNLPPLQMAIWGIGPYPKPFGRYCLIGLREEQLVLKQAYFMENKKDEDFYLHQ